jgi:hypothetical protein
VAGHVDRARFVWCDRHGEGRNVFVLFRRRFQLADRPRGAHLHLFADSAYRLCVNGRVAGYGPARFFPRHPHYDTVDLAPDLRPGLNTLTVEVHSRGAPCFQAVASRGGFIAWGRVGAEDLATPGRWEVCRLGDRDPWAPPFSFAIGPVEMRDLRRHAGPWYPAVRHAHPGHWGRLTPRPTPLLGLEQRRPTRLLQLAALSDRELRIGYRADVEPPGGQHPRPHTQFVVWIYSPRRQRVCLGLFWGDHYLNGRLLRRRDERRLGNRQAARADLRAGWNLLFGDVELLTAGWTVLLGLPRGRGLEVAAEPRHNCADVLLHAEPLAPWTGPAPRRAEDLPAHPWKRQPRGALAGHPAREMAWDELLPVTVATTAPPVPVRLPVGKNGAATAVFDFGAEFLGHPRLEVDAPAGTMVDVGVSETLRADKALDLYGFHFGINAADRYVLRGGRQVLETFHPRGGRYLQVSVRHARGAVRLRSVTVRQTTTPVQVTGSFCCSDPLLTWVWNAGRDTVLAALEDAYVDCPLRERGAYVADSYVTFHTHRLLARDLSVAARTLELFAQGQRADGQLPACAPSSEARALWDFTLIWVIWLRDFWAATGRLDLAQKHWPVVDRIFASPTWRETADGLWEVEPSHGFVFIDWGTTRPARGGANGVLNAFRYRALQCAAELARQLGRPADARRYRREARRVDRAFQRLWKPRDGHFAAFRAGATLADEPALHANALALAFGLTQGEQADAVRAYLRRGLARTWRERPGALELYFFGYLLAALYRCDDVAGAEAAVRAVYGRLRRRGVWTLPEVFSRRRNGVGSQCHPWSSSPCRYLTEEVLGIRPARPGRTRDWVVAPRSATVRWAHGVMPTPHGELRVGWQRRGRRLEMEVVAPPALRVSVRPAGELARLECQWVRRSG